VVVLWSWCTLSPLPDLFTQTVRQQPAGHLSAVQGGALAASLQVGAAICCPVVTINHLSHYSPHSSSWPNHPDHQKPQRPQPRPPTPQGSRGALSRPPPGAALLPGRPAARVPAAHAGVVRALHVCRGAGRWAACTHGRMGTACMRLLRAWGV